MTHFYVLAKQIIVVRTWGQELSNHAVCTASVIDLFQQHE